MLYIKTKSHFMLTNQFLWTPCIVYK